jgi:hypothetical protein
MKECIVTLQSTSPYSQSRFHNLPKQEKEGPDQYEERTWKERCHYTPDGNVYMPALAFKNCLSECARYLGIPIKGKGKQTYTKHFESGILVLEPLVLPVTRETIHGEWWHVPSDGRRGGSKRVMKCFPIIPEWSGDVLFYILDDTITEDVFIYHVEQAGKFIGVGSFRVRNNGIFGRFKIVGEPVFQNS